MGSGATIGDRTALFEAVHGSAPDIAGKGIANPSALMLAACMMLDHLGEEEAAARARTAVEQTLRDGSIRTPDLKGNATTQESTDAVIGRLD